MKKLVSVVIRTKNEERWISKCLQEVFNQAHDDFDVEVIIVDNNSSDKTLEKIKQFDGIKTILPYNDKDYFPGKALNLGIKEAKGNFIACLSGHCVPSSPQWLKNLLRNFNREIKVAGIYGRQEPYDFTPDADKRDLALTFGLDRKVQIKDSFFHNANSMIRKDLWESIPFDESATNIEDRIWAKEALQRGYRIIYEPEASVYHYHGIHQNGDEKRCRNAVRILENLYSDYPYRSIDVKKLNIVAIIPIKGEIQYLAGKPLLAYTAQRALESKYIKKTIISTDNPELARIGEKFGAETPFIRDKTFSESHIDLARVFQYSLNKIEETKIFPDIIVCLEITFPFRTNDLIDNMILHLTQKGLDSVVAAKLENKAVWKEKDDGVVQLDEGFTPRQFKSPTFVELRGLACVTHPEFLRSGNIFGQKMGIYEVKNPYSPLEIRDEKDTEMASFLIKKWFYE